MNYNCSDDNIDLLREKYPDGLHFAVGDLHGEVKTLMDLMEKIRFDPGKDHVYFVGDYNSGGSVYALLQYISNYYSEDLEKPGFHLLRGNHEYAELWPIYKLDNLPNIFVIRRKNINFYIAHAGMISSVFDLISNDIKNNPEQNSFAYKLEDHTVAYNAPLRLIVYSRGGLYSRRVRWTPWPSENSLKEKRAYIIHGHTPYCFLYGPHVLPYGEKNLFWENQHIWFSEDLHSFNIDSNVKGRYKNGEGYRGLTCMCFEVFDEIASNNNELTIDSICNADNGIFAVPYSPCWNTAVSGDINRILNAHPAMKVISTNELKQPYII